MRVEPFLNRTGAFIKDTHRAPQPFLLGEDTLKSLILKRALAKP